jgi:hypothetical protein
MAAVAIIVSGAGANAAAVRPLRPPAALPLRVIRIVG